MNENFRIVQETYRHWYIQDYYEGIPIFMRKCKVADGVDICFNDNFAKANGYKSREDMIVKNIGSKEKLLGTYGHLPKWVHVTPDGRFLLIPDNENEILTN